MATKKVRTKRSVTDYAGYSEKSQPYEVPDMWIGSAEKQKLETHVFDMKTKKFVEKNLTIPEGVIRLYIEIISNSADNVDASRRAGVDPGTIEVLCDEHKTSIKNYGLHISVKKVGLKTTGGKTEVVNYEEGMTEFEWLPAYIFGQLRTSSNYDKNVIRYGCGRNGVGAKIVNLFSKVFTVTVEDPDLKRRFTGVWKENMFKDHPEKKPEITIDEDETIEKGSVKIEWALDFERFGMKNYSKSEIGYFARIAADFSFTCKIPIFFNSEKLDYRSIYDYASLYFSEEEIANSLVQYTWGTTRGKNKNELHGKSNEQKVKNPKTPRDIPDLEIMILDTPDKSRLVSYVNGLVTRDGGVHVDAVQEPIFKYLSAVINNDKRGKKKSGAVISSKNIRPHLSFIVNARLPDPKYDSQSKTKLNSPNIYVGFDDRVLKKLNNWDIIQRLQAELEAIGFRMSSSSDGRKKKHILMDKGEDANFAGTKHSGKCIAWLVEGVSASNYPQKRICMTKDGKDFNGYMPMRGKLLNITKANSEKYSENKVVSLIKQFIGLKEGVDYNRDQNLESLRYGTVIITADADVDGMHIVALVLNLFREKFPGLLKRNRVAYLRTPVIKILKAGKITHRFFSEDEFKKWRSVNSTDGLRIRYYKGLGTSNDSDIKDDLKTAPTIICFYDDECVKNFNLAFHEDRSDCRKEWIEKWRDLAQTDDVLSVDISKIRSKDGTFKGQNISQFINRELIGYSVASLVRAIPSEYDHLKESQRKALYTALNHWNYTAGGKKESMKVQLVASKIAYELQYHHGDKSLADTIIKMAQDYIGSNNLGYFYQDGQFGTRADGGENAAEARYSEIQLNWWIPYVYYKESVDIVEKVVVDDKPCEPRWIPGVIPIGVVNGMNGIATGYSTGAPCYSPLDVTRWYIERCKNSLSGNGKMPNPILPWFNGFEGELVVEQGAQKKPGMEELLPGDINTDSPVTGNGEIETDKENLAVLQSARKSRRNLKTYGKFEKAGLTKNEQQIIKITELPVRTWIIRYRKWLESIIAEKGKDRLITDMVDRSSTEKVNFEIHWNSKSLEPNITNLHLVRSFGLSNITLINHAGLPKKYADNQEVMETYFLHMLNHYSEIRQKRIDFEEQKIRDISYKMKFIEAVLEGKIKLIKVDEEKVKSSMEEMEIPFEYYDKSRSRDFSNQSLERYRQMVEECKAKAELAKNTTPEKIWIEKLQKLEEQLLKRFRGGKFINK